MESLFGVMAKGVGCDPRDVRVKAEAGIGGGIGEPSYVLNYNIVSTKDGKELFRVINMISIEADSVEAQEELAALFSHGRGDMGIILSGGEMHVFVNPSTQFRPLLRLTRDV